MIASTRPTLVIIAGPNGTDKSTLRATLRGPAGIPVLDPDAIARLLRPDAPEQAATQAAREVVFSVSTWRKVRASPLCGVGLASLWETRLAEAARVMHKRGWM